MTCRLHYLAIERVQVVPHDGNDLVLALCLKQNNRRGSVHDRSVRLPSDSQAYYVNEATRDRHVNQERCPGVDFKT